ncbi:MAG TPA: NUDIX domain-containing protein [Bacteroidia bacterium]|jgi:8-oxo-dGTP diphosphatase|nr:NUDIX domain-containing protein [Bacteroidia bacterium]HMU18603.1 NUDIX domain-containing protein [Bacteroidia bacterium]
MKPFVIRVYGILINKNAEVLLTHEKEEGKEFTKFPGGGLEFGEGLRECLVREFLEETHQKVEVMEHFYTTDFFIESAFNPDLQLISVYYKVSCENFILPQDANDIHFFWKPLKELNGEVATFPVDRIVEKLLM